MSTITHVIFDVDGLLLNTESVYTESISNFLTNYNCTFNYTLKRKMMGRKFIEAGQVLIDELSLPITAAEFIDHQTEYLTPQRWESVECMPGAVSVVNYLAKCGVPMAAATGCTSKELHHKMKNHKVIFDQLKHWVCAGDDPDVKRGKPFPDVFLIAAKRFNDQPVNMNQILVFEDAPNGVEAAVAAGMNVIWIPDPCEPPTPYPENITPTDASRVTRLDSLLSFKPEKFGLPPF